MNFTPYRYNECFEHSYYQIPQELFKNSNYREKLSSDSKILYAFLLDRLKLSNKNHWIDLEKNIYLIFTRQEVQDKLNLSEKTVIKAFKQLSNVGLIYEKRQGLGKPNLIYVGKIQHDEYMDDTNLKNIQLQNCNFYSSKDGNNTVLDMKNLQGINPNNINTNIINTNRINPKSDDEQNLENIKIKCELNKFSKEEQVILEDVIDSLYYKDSLKVGSVVINHYKILDKLQLIVKDNLVQLLDILQNIPNIKNAKNYLMICLYNNLGNTHITSFKKKVEKNRPEERSYLPSSFDFLYDNLGIAQVTP